MAHEPRVETLSRAAGPGRVLHPERRRSRPAHSRRYASDRCQGPTALRAELAMARQSPVAAFGQIPVSANVRRPDDPGLASIQQIEELWTLLPEIRRMIEEHGPSIVFLPSPRLSRSNLEGGRHPWRTRSRASHLDPATTHPGPRDRSRRTRGTRRVTPLRATTPLVVKDRSPQGRSPPQQRPRIAPGMVDLGRVRKSSITARSIADAAAL